jgi:hypothetical protein
MRSLIREIDHLLDLLETYDKSEYIIVLLEIQKIENKIKEIIGR